MSDKIQKVLAQAGLGSRREIEKWVVAGRVSVNGKLATTGDRVGMDDKITVDGRVVKLQPDDSRIRVLMYHKPVGEICTRNDPERRKTVFSSLPPIKNGRWIAVGRLDINTSGLMLFTNDGELANRQMHPSGEVERQYLVRIHGVVSDDMLKRLQEGIMLDDGIGRFKKIQIGDGSGNNQWFTVVIAEGRNREVRRLWESQGVEVSRLKRIRYGDIELPSYVRSGDWLDLSPVEVSRLCKSMGINNKPKALTPSEHQQRERQLSKLKSRGAQQR